MDVRPRSLLESGAERSTAQRERRVRGVLAVTAGTMVVELGAGHVTGSLALAADGWHMVTHSCSTGCRVWRRRGASVHGSSRWEPKCSTSASGKRGPDASVAW
jgi:Co/Zn/Cd efflux system component